MRFRTTEECLRLATDCRHSAEVADALNEVRWLQLARKLEQVAEIGRSNLVRFSVYRTDRGTGSERARA